MDTPSNVSLLLNPGKCNASHSEQIVNLKPVIPAAISNKENNHGPMQNSINDSKMNGILSGESALSNELNMSKDPIADQSLNILQIPNNNNDDQISSNSHSTPALNHIDNTNHQKVQIAEQAVNHIQTKNSNHIQQNDNNPEYQQQHDSSSSGDSIQILNENISDALHQSNIKNHAQTETLQNGESNPNQSTNDNIENDIDSLSLNGNNQNLINSSIAIEATNEIKQSQKEQMDIDQHPPSTTTKTVVNALDNDEDENDDDYDEEEDEDAESESDDNSEDLIADDAENDDDISSELLDIDIVHGMHPLSHSNPHILALSILLIYKY